MHMHNMHYTLCIMHDLTGIMHLITLTHFVATSKYSNGFQLQVKHKAEAALFQGQSKQASICIVNL